MSRDYLLCRHIDQTHAQLLQTCERPENWVSKLTTEGNRVASIELPADTTEYLTLPHFAEEHRRCQQFEGSASPPVFDCDQSLAFNFKNIWVFFVDNDNNIPINNLGRFLPHL